MALCALCQPLGTWFREGFTEYLTPSSPSSTSTSGFSARSKRSSLSLSDWAIDDDEIDATVAADESLNSRPHHPSFSALEASATNGCRFCAHLIRYLNIFSEEVSGKVGPTLPVLQNGFVKRTMPFRVLEKQGKDTAVVLKKEGDGRVRVRCGEFGGMDWGLEVYVLPGDPAAVK